MKPHQEQKRKITTAIGDFIYENAWFFRSVVIAMMGGIIGYAVGHIMLARDSNPAVRISKEWEHTVETEYIDDLVVVRNFGRLVYWVDDDEGGRWFKFATGVLEPRGAKLLQRIETTNWHTHYVLISTNITTVGLEREANLPNITIRAADQAGGTTNP